MHSTCSPASAGPSLPLIPGSVTYYPAQRRGTFASVKAALAAIGCVGADADRVIALARVNGSPMIAVGAAFTSRPGEEFAAVIQRKPGGKAVLWLGCLEIADEDRAFVADAARQFAEASGTEWAIFEWTRQTGAVQ